MSAAAFLMGAYSAVGFGGALLVGGYIRNRLRSVPAPSVQPLMIEEEAMEQLSLIDAMERRDEVLADVVEHNTEWSIRAIGKFHEHKHRLSEDFIGEDIRDLLIKAGISHRPQAWGPLINVLLRGKQIEKTGTYRKMQAAGSNARESRCYRLARELEPA